MSSTSSRYTRKPENIEGFEVCIVLRKLKHYRDPSTYVNSLTIFITLFLSGCREKSINTDDPVPYYAVLIRLIKR